MKPYQRRQQHAYPYYKVAMWNARSFCWADGRTAYSSEEEALRSIPSGVPGKYRLSRVTETGRTDLVPFEVGPMVGGD